MVVINKFKNTRGTAMIVALMVSFILLALLLSLIFVSTSTSRQANYAQKMTIALNLAEAGMADALYRLNYTTTGNYPFDSSGMPPNFTSTVSGSGATATITGAPPGAEGTYKNTFTDDATNPNKDKITSVGTYKGVRRTLSVLLRGNNTVGSDRQALAQGIAEAFNKHGVYANIVQVQSGFSGSTITGNVVYTTDPTPPNTLPSSGTRTKVNSSLFGVPTPVAPGIAFPPTAPTPTIIFHDDDSGVNPYDNSMGPPYLSTLDFSGYYDGTSIDYIENTSYDIIASDSVNTAIWKFESDALHPFITLSVLSNLTNSFYSDKAVTVGAFTVNASVGTDTAIYSGETITINGATITGAVTAVGKITINSGTTITGIVKTQGDVDIDASTGNITLNGSVVSGGTITLKNSNVNTITINTGSSTLPAALYAGSGIDIQNTATNLTVTLGQKQKAAVMAYGAGAVSVTVSSNLTPTYNDTNVTQAALVAYSTSGNTSVSISSTVGASNNGRLIYAGSGGTSNFATITLSSGAAVTGTLVAGGTDATTPAPGTVNLNEGTLSWDSIPFKSTAEVYQGFSGGRRTYLPVLRSWSQRE